MGKPRTGRVKALGLIAGLFGAFAAVLSGVALRPAEPNAAADFGSPGTGTGTTVTAEKHTPTVPQPPAGEPRSAPARPPALPESISIPRLGVRAPVDSVGVTPDGQVVVPEDPDRLGWYRFSPAPGTGGGSSVIVGHVDAMGRGLGVLAVLGEAREGDRVLLGRRDGTEVTYRVVARRTIAKTALGESGAFRRDGEPVLTLITCVGPYLPDGGGYQNNLVVTAAEVPR
ncbi:sortase domain-containing protein [Streptomyces sp. bgisy060]|uniref:class F sortase n=1 Tax=Streptomyces sp. bgisy060 TaxID=3413775 RepID=UPI003EBCF8AE